MKNTPIIRNTNLRFNSYPPIFLHLILIIYQKKPILQGFWVELSKHYANMCQPLDIGMPLAMCLALFRSFSLNAVEIKIAKTA